MGRLHFAITPYLSQVKEIGNMTQKELFDKISRQSTVTQMQEYIDQVVKLRGFDNQPIGEVMLLLTEEVGELAKAIRKTDTKMSMDVDNMQNFDTVESEVADVFFVLLAICNQMNINLFDALKEKEKSNLARNWTFDR